MDPTNEGVSRDVLDCLEERKHAFSCRMYGLVDIMSRTVFARMEKRTSVYKDLLDKLIEQMFGLFRHELDAAWRDRWAHRDSLLNQCICRDDVLDSEIVSESVLMNGGVGGDVLDRLEERKHAFSCRMYGLVDIMSRTVFARMEKRTSVYKDLLDQLVEQMFGLFSHELDAAWRDGWAHRDSSLHQCICRDDLLDSEIVSEPRPIPEQTLSQVSSLQQLLPECNEEMDDGECFEFVCDEQENWIVDDDEMAHNLDCVEENGKEYNQSNDLAVVTGQIVSGDDEIADENDEDCDMGEYQHIGDCVLLPNDDDHMDDVEAKNDDNSTLPQPSSTLSKGEKLNDDDHEVMDSDSHIEEIDKKDEQANHEDSSVDGDINEIVQQIRNNVNFVDGQVGDDDYYENGDDDLNGLDVEAKRCDDATLPQPSSDTALHNDDHAEEHINQEAQLFNNEESSSVVNSQMDCNKNVECNATNLSVNLPMEVEVFKSRDEQLKELEHSQRDGEHSQRDDEHSQKDDEKRNKQNAQVEVSNKSLPINHICSFCFEVFQKLSEYNRHLGSHIVDSSIQCRSHPKARYFACTWKDCGKRFNTQFDLNRHKCIHTGEKPFKCAWKGCEMTFFQKGNCEKHYKNRHCIQSISGQTDASTMSNFISMDSVSSQQQRQHSKSLKSAKSTLTRPSSSLTRPSSSLTQPSSYLTQLSSSLSQTSSSLPQKKPYECPRENCDRTFISRGGIRIHFDFHDRMLRLLGINEDEIKKHSRFDEQAIRKGRKLSVKKLSVGSGSKETKICHSEHRDDRLNELGDRVNVELKKPSDLKRHIPKHRRERPHACTLEWCDKTFRKFKHLKTHNRNIHTESPHICPRKRCHQTFARKSQLREHYMSHSDGKRFKCPWNGCEKIYTFENTMKHHYKTQHRSIQANSIVKTL